LKRQQKKLLLKYFLKKVGNVLILSVLKTNFMMPTSCSLEPAARQIKLKIHNLNLDDLMDEQKQIKLLEIFRKILWPASSLDLHFVELYSALAVGGRRPARQQDGEGYLATGN
jgi:hypothetical protein